MSHHRTSLDPTVVRIAAANCNFEYRYTEVITDEELSELIDQTAVLEQDQFIRMVWDVRNILYSLPYSMGYGKFNYMCAELSRQTRHNSFVYLPHLYLQEVYTEEIRSIVRDMPIEHHGTFRKLVIRRMDCTLTDIVRAKLSGRMTTLGDVRRCLTHTALPDGTFLEILYENYRVTGCSDCDYEYILRLKLAECPHITARATLLLTERLIPLDVIPGARSIDEIKYKLSAYTRQNSISQGCVDPRTEWERAEE